MRRDFCLTFLQRLSYYTLLSLREKTNYKIVVKVVHSWRLDSARKGRKGGATRSGKGFRRSVFVVVLFYSSSRRSRRRRRSARACFPLMRALMSSRCVSHRIIIIVSLERGVSSPQKRVSFCFLLLLLRGTPRARKSDEGNESCFRVRETIFRRRFLLRRFLRGTFLPPRRRDGDETRIRETIGLTPLFFFSTKTHCIIIIIIKRQQRKHNSACRRRRTRRNAKTFERTTWSVCITKKSFNARTRSKRKRTDNAGKKRRRYGPRSRNTSTIRAGER